MYENIYMEKILKEIVETKLNKKKEVNITLPEKRVFPLIKPDFRDGFIICEIKRASPSEGLMKNIYNPEKWASRYFSAGANAISVLTEENYFSGKLDDLIQIKKVFPDKIVLRKDFLFTDEDIDISYYAGADIILLIASVLIDLDKNHSLDLLKKLKKKSDFYGMSSLIEVHNIHELEAVLEINPEIIGVNSRDLKTFKINRNYPFALLKLIPDHIVKIYESGIRGYSDAFFIGLSGFSAILVGTSVVKTEEERIEEKIGEIRNGFINGLMNKSRFYKELFYKIYIEDKIVVKICGITNLEDALFAVKCGADIIGFVFAESPRKITFKKAKEISDKLPSHVLKVGVVVNENILEAVKAVKEGWLDAIQFHGDYDNDFCQSFNCCWYKAVRVKDEKSLDNEFYSPIVLYDAFSKDSYGGTGKQIDENLIKLAKMKKDILCLAGGINPDNILEILNKFTPSLIDLSSGVEEKPGKKDHKKIALLFEKIKSFKN